MLETELQNTTLYDEIRSGSDFTYYQDCNYDPKKNATVSYEEHYFNPDCVLLFPENKEFVWFDLDYTGVLANNKTGTRQHMYGPHNLKRKFAISNQNNKLGVLDYSLLYSKIHRQSQLKPQKTKEFKYIIREKYKKFCDVNSDGTISSEDNSDLNHLWKSFQKIKIAVKLGNFILIYPIRLSFMNDNIYSFSSKNVVIPNLDASSFSWESSYFGNICVATDGTCSTWVRSKHKNILKYLIPTLFPQLSNFASIIDIKPKSSLKRVARNLTRPFIKLMWDYFVPYKVEYHKCSFEILYAPNENN